MEEPTKRAVIYCRVSTVDQAEEGDSLNTQEKICRAYAANNGYEIVEDGVYIERGESAKTANRPVLLRMLDFCSSKKRGISAVIIYKVDRLSRNTDDYSSLRLLLRRYGVGIKSATENLTDTPAGRFMENQMANIAQFDNEVRSERCGGGMREAMRNGRYVWPAPVGYSNVRVADKATIAPSDAAHLIRRAFELASTGLHTTDDVWRIVCKEGLVKRNGKAPSRTYFHTMLKNELYTGWMEKFNERCKGAFEPVISEALFKQVQRVLRNKGHLMTEYKTNNPVFPLRRFISSPDGIKLTGSIAKGKYPYYRFNGGTGGFKKEELERRFAEFMDSYRFKPAQLKRLHQLIEARFHGATETERKDSQKLEKRLSELKDKQSALVEKNLRGVLNDSILKQELDRIEKEEAAVNASLSSYTASTASPKEAVAFASEYLERPSAIWIRAKNETKTNLQRFQFPLGIIFDGEKFGTPQVCSLFTTKDAFSAPLSSVVDRTGFEPATPSLQMRCSTN